VSSDHQRQLAIDRILAGVREAAEASMRSYATAVAESATDEFRRQANTEIAHLRDTVQRLEITRLDIESRLAEARRLLEETRREADQLIADANAARDSEIAAERLRADAAIGDAARRAQAEIAAIQQTMESRVEELTGQLAAASTEVVRARSLASALGSLDAAVSLSAVLDRLAELAATVVARGALFMVEGATFSCWRAIGFDPEGTPEALAQSADVRFILAAAVRDRRLVTRPMPDEAVASLSTATIDRVDAAAAAVPVFVAGRIVAVLYGETQHRDGPLLDDWCPALETAARYAGRVLESLTIRLALQAGSPLVRPAQPGANQLPEELS
jgi:hypothetical protein